MNSFAPVAIIIPFYKNELSFFETIALEQCKKILHKYPQIIIKPESLILPKTMTGGRLVECFEDKYFSSVHGYNQLMLSPTFYERFLNYKYILIHQLDAFLFEDQLEYWCTQEFDYIGAPWISETDYTGLLDELTTKIKGYLYARYNVKYKDGTPKRRQLENRVGNGGFSLRRVSIFAEYSSRFDYLINEYRTRSGSWFNEDIFWSIEINRKKQRLKIPVVKKALQFAFETHPERALRLNNNQMPFGCHAWEKNLDFWRPIFKNYGYDI